jgi:hypothetical protein
MVAEGIIRLGVSPILAPEGLIPIDNDEGLRAYFTRYVVPGLARLAASRTHNTGFGFRRKGLVANDFLNPPNANSTTPCLRGP